MPLSYRVYILQNSKGRLYIGMSENVEERLRQHNSGESKWTAKYRPWTMIWTSDARSLSDARRLENLLKRQKGGDGLYRITGLTRPPRGS